MEIERLSSLKRFDLILDDKPDFKGSDAGGCRILR